MTEKKPCLNITLTEEINEISRLVGTIIREISVVGIEGSTFLGDLSLLVQKDRNSL